MAAEFAANGLEAFSGPATPTAKPRTVEGPAVSPPRRQSEKATDPDIPTALWLSPRLRAWGYFLREIGLPYFSVAGVFALLGAIFYYVLLPQNQQSIDNQKSLQTSIAKQMEINESWGSIMKAAMENEARFKPALEALTAEVRGLRDDIRGMKSK